MFRAHADILCTLSVFEHWPNGQQWGSQAQTYLILPVFLFHGRIELRNVQSGIIGLCGWPVVFVIDCLLHSVKNSGTWYYPPTHKLTVSATCGDGTLWEWAGSPVLRDMANGELLRPKKLQLYIYVYVPHPRCTHEDTTMRSIDRTLINCVIVAQSRPDVWSPPRGW